MTRDDLIPLAKQVLKQLDVIERFFENHYAQAKEERASI